MKRTFVVGLILVTWIAVLGCRNGERASITGAYGAGFLSGQVVMAGGSSPAGVEVSLRGTGMTTVLGEDGRFAFSGVPDGAELGFRRADGIDASLRLEEASGHLVVELDKSTAKKSSRRRSSGRGGAKTYEFEGLIRSASDTEIVVFTSHKVEVTIVLTPDTVIRKGGTLLTPADLLVDMRVHVKAAKADDVYTAVLVIVQNEDDDDGDDDRPELRQYEGLVVSAAADRLVIFDSHKQEVEFVVDAETEIRKGNTPVAAEDIQPGWRVHVKAKTATDGVNTAVLVIVQNTKSR